MNEEQHLVWLGRCVKDRASRVVNLNYVSNEIKPIRFVDTVVYDAVDA